MYTAPVFLLSDFGLEDTYVAQMKAAVLASAGGSVPLLDLCHTVPPGDVLSGAFHLRAALPNLPRGSVVLAVIDPGVGSSRAGLAVTWQGRHIIAPDNGLITLLDSPIECRKLPEPAEGSSSTFHGRDLFAPCAARVAMDPDWIRSLDVLNGEVRLRAVENTFSGGALGTTVLHVDHFGNCILNISSETRGVTGQFNTAASPVTHTALKHADHYQQGGPGEVLLLAGSQGFMELAVNGGSAASVLGLAPGDRITLAARGSGSQ